MSDETAVMVVEQRGRVTQLNQSVNQRWEELMEKAKPFQISKRIVFEAYQQVKANTIKRWRLHRWSGATLNSIAAEINPVVRGWINYYGRYIRSEVRSPLQQIDLYLVRWAKGKYKRLRGHQCRASAWVAGIRSRDPQLFAHWAAGMSRWG